MTRKHGSWIPLISTKRNLAKECDERMAEEFLASPNAYLVFNKFVWEADAEIRYDMTKLGMYIKCRAMGVDPVFAAMRACRRAPAAKGMDRHFNEGARRRMNGMGQKSLAKILAVAQNAGISTQGKFYVGGLGRYNDPQAWCSTIDDVLGTAKRKNLEMTGVAEHKMIEMDVQPRKQGLAPDIMARFMSKYFKDDPGLAQKAKKNPRVVNELKERIVATHARKAVGV